MTLTLNLSRCPGCGKYVKQSEAGLMGWHPLCYQAFVEQEIPLADARTVP